MPGYPLGLPLVMAAARRMAGELGPYLVAPAFVALAVLATWAIARRVAGPLAGATGAVALGWPRTRGWHVLRPPPARGARGGRAGPFCSPP